MVIDMRTNAVVILILVFLINLSCAGNSGENGGQPAGEDNGNVSDTGESGVGSDPPGETVSIADLSRGLQVWQAETTQCRTCHRIGDDPGGNSGPALTGIGDRYTRDEIKTWIQNPQEMNPDTTMPPQELSDEDLEYLARYLSMLSSDTAE